MRTLAAAGLALALLGASGPALAGIELLSPPATVGRQATVLLTDESGPLPGREVSATYYPASAVAVTDPIGRTDAAGRLSFRPRLAGLVELSAEGVAPTTLGVRFERMPVSALVVFLVAAGLLFGGVALGASRLKGTAG